MPAVIPGASLQTGRAKYIARTLWSEFSTAFINAGSDTRLASGPLKQVYNNALIQYPDMQNLVKSIALCYHRCIFLPLNNMHDETEA